MVKSFLKVSTSNNDDSQIKTQVWCYRHSLPVSALLADLFHS